MSVLAAILTANHYKQLIPWPWGCRNRLLISLCSWSL